MKFTRIDTLDVREAEKAKKEPKDILNSYIKKRWGKLSADRKTIYR